jgi:peptide/nickel transport system substrate-binding protein
MIRKLMAFFIIFMLFSLPVMADTNTDIPGNVILKKNFRLYFDKGRQDGVAIGQRLDIIYEGSNFGSGLVSWVGDDIAYSKLDSVTYYRYYYLEDLQVRIYLESTSRFTGGAIHVPFFNDLSLSPSLISLPDEFAVGYLIYDNLVRMDGDGNIQPGLAHSWEVHGNTYTFYLNQNIKFHSGKYLDALDVAYSLVQLAKAPSVTPASSFITQINGYEEVHQSGRNELRGVFMPNKYTIAITTKDAFVPFLKYLSGPGGFIIPATERTPVSIGTGPFKVASINDDNIVLAANADYFENPPALDSIIFNRYGSYKEAALDFDLGRIDLICFDSRDDSELLTGGGDYLSRQYYTNSLVLLGFNCGHSFQKNFELAKALNGLFDRESIVRVLLGNSARAATSLIKPTFGIASSYSDINLFFPDDSREMLGKISDLPKQLNLVYDNFTPSLQPVADYLSGQIRHAGVKINVQKTDSRDLKKSVAVSSMDLYLFRYDIPVDDPDALFYPLFSNSLNGQTNYLNYNNPELGRFLEGARRIEDVFAREDIYQEAEEVIMKKPPVIVLYNPYMTVANRRDLAGFKPDKRAFVNLRDAYFQISR